MNPPKKGPWTHLLILLGAGALLAGAVFLGTNAGTDVEQRAPESKSLVPDTTPPPKIAPEPVPLQEWASLSEEERQEAADDLAQNIASMAAAWGEGWRQLVPDVTRAWRGRWPQYCGAPQYSLAGFPAGRKYEKLEQRSRAAFLSELATKYPGGTFGYGTKDMGENVTLTNVEGQEVARIGVISILPVCDGESTAADVP